MSPNTQPKTAIVTGAAQGIGKAIAIQLANDGFSVVISDIAAKQSLMDDVAAEIKAKNPDTQTLVVPADVSSASDVNNLVAKTKETFGGLDVVRSLPTVICVAAILIQLRRWSLMLAFAGRILYSMVRIWRLVHLIILYTLDKSYRRRMGETIRHQRSRSAALLSSCGKINDRAKTRWSDNWSILSVVYFHFPVLTSRYRCFLNCWKERQRDDRCIFRQQICHPIANSNGRYDVSALALLEIRSFRLFRLACEWGVHGITVNAYAPGTIDTPMCRYSPLLRLSYCSQDYS